MEKKPINLVKGMNTDSKHEYQPEGTYRFALNSVRETDIGEIGSISNEEGNKECFNTGLGPNFHLVGACNIGDNTNVLFFTDDTVTVIGKVRDCMWEVLMITDCLNISRHYFVDIEYRVHNGCDTIIYFTDGHNKYRSINLSRLDRYLKLGRSLSDANTLVGGTYGWDCGLINHSPDYNPVDIYLTSIDTGGRLRIGAYQFTIRYLDDQYNPTGWSTVSNPVYIDGDNSNTSHSGTGGVLGLPDQDGFRYTNKSITITFDNVDTRYKYYQIGILQATLGTSEINEGHVTSRFSINDTRINYTLTSTSGLQVISTQEISVNNRFIPVVQAHVQVENKLLLGNISSPSYDWLEYQKIANDIKVEYVVYEGEDSTDFKCELDIVHGQADPFSNIREERITNTSIGDSYAQEGVSFDNKTYMRDEVYALGIVFILKDGTESPVFHIPGRPPIGTGLGAVTTYNVNGFNYNSERGREQWDLLDESYSIGVGIDEWDTKEYSIDTTLEPYLFGPGATNVYNPNSIHVFEDIYSTQGCSTTVLPRWKHVNTSIKRQAADYSVLYDQSDYKHKYKVTEVGLPAYYETDTVYPDVLDCNGVPVFPHIDNGDGTYRMLPIRHHKMPDSRKVHIQRVDNNNVLWIRPLGLGFTNIVIPSSIQSQISGYYIVRGDRAGNKTVLDKGWMNVCDMSTGAGGFQSGQFLPGLLNSENRILQTNVLFMSPNFKQGMGQWQSSPFDNGGFKDPDTAGGFDVVEFFTPKSFFNELVNLGGSYFKLENTVHGDRIQLQTSTNDYGNNYRVAMSEFLCRMKQPRVATYAKRVWYSLQQVIPIDGMEFALYNQSSISTIRSGFMINNERFRQDMGLATLYKDRYWVEGTSFYKVFNKPYMYASYNYNATGGITSGVADLVPIVSYDGTEFNDLTVGANGAWVAEMRTATLSKWVTESDAATSGRLGSTLKGTAAGNTAYTYYVAIKSNIIPYRKLENIVYRRTTNFNIESSHVIIGGGDCFISPLRLFKSYIDNTPTAENERKYITTNLTGLVESEINCNKRFKEAGDNYNAVPFNSIYDTVVTQPEELITEIRESINQEYKYSLDHSRDNNVRTPVSLPDYYDYCQECQESFPNLIVYSEPTTPEQVFDSYKRFRPNSVIEVGPESGAITNMIIKENNMFVHTEGNTWRFNISSQSIQTNNDTIQVGSNELGNTMPSRLFDNASGSFRGGTLFKQTNKHCEDMYIWVDSSTNHVYALQGGAKELSYLKRYFDVNLTLELDDQYRRVTGKPYPYKGTTSADTIGFHAVYDPNHKRYILTKKDYKALITIKLPPDNPPYETDVLYALPTGFYVALTTDAEELVKVELHNTLLFRNESWTISYDLKADCWWSFHSYIPNFYFNDDSTFYSFIENPNIMPSSGSLRYNQFVWKHNTENYQTFYNTKFDFVLELVYNGDPYTDRTFDNFELASNAYLFDTINNYWKEIQFSTIDRFYAYNNNQVTGLKSLTVSNLNPYSRISYGVNNATIDKDRNIWRVSRIRDLSVNRLTSTQSMFSNNWLLPTYSSQFNRGFGYIDKIINPNYISVTKNSYQMERLTDKYLSVRSFYNPSENYKLTINIFNSIKRPRI